LWRGERVTSSDVPSRALVTGSVVGLGVGHWWFMARFLSIVVR
jgi:hypothetical protein